MNQAYQEYKNTLSKINKILGYESDIKMVFSEKGAGTIRQTLDVITNQLEKTYKNEKIEPTGEEKSLVRGTVNLFVDIVLGKPITPIFRDLSTTYLLLVFNWNQVLGKRPDVERDIKLVDMIIKGQLTMLDTIRVLRQLLPKLKAMEQYEPPAFDLSRAYLNSLKKEFKGQEPKLKRSKSKRPKPREKKLDSKKLRLKKKQRIKK
jgi:hypothetical protein